MDDPLVDYDDDMDLDDATPVVIAAPGGARTPAQPQEIAPELQVPAGAGKAVGVGAYVDAITSGAPVVTAQENNVDNGADQPVADTLSVEDALAAVRDSVDELITTGPCVVSVVNPRSRATAVALSNRAPVSGPSVQRLLTILNDMGILRPSTAVVPLSSGSTRNPLRSVLPTAGTMVVTRSRSAELEDQSHLQRQQRRQQQEQEREQEQQPLNQDDQLPSGLRPNMDNSDPRVEMQTIGGVRYSSPISFDGVGPGEHGVIADIPWFSRTAVIADEADDFKSLDRYAWDGDFYWGVPTDALRFRVWRDVIAVDAIDLSWRGSAPNKLTRHVRDVRKGLMSMAYAPCVREDMDVDLWRYRTFRERSYVEGLCALTAEQLDDWRGRYCVHADAICWDRPFLKSHFRYEDRSSSTYWTTQLAWERRTLSALGRFVPYHLLCCYNLTEQARDRLFPLIPPLWSRLATCHGFRVEQEPIFSYKSGALVEDPQSGLWVVAITERVTRVCAALLVAAYAEYRLWYVPPDIIAFARELGMSLAAPLGSRDNVRELSEFLEVIESTRFDSLPATWNCRPNRAVDHHLGGSEASADFFYYDPFLRRKIDEATAKSRAAAYRVIPDDIPVGWDHEEEDVERTRRDTSRDYRPGIAVYPPYVIDSPSNIESPVRTPELPAAAAPVASVPSQPPASNEYSDEQVAGIRRFLRESGVLPDGETTMSIPELRGFVRGKCSR